MGKLVLFLRRRYGAGHQARSRADRRSGAVRTTTSALPQAPVSGEHAAVVTILDDSFLEDLGSTNGTLVNGKPITKHFLRDRDEIDIGREILVYLDRRYGDDSRAAARPERAAAHRRQPRRGDECRRSARQSPFFRRPAVDFGPGGRRHSAGCRRGNRRERDRTGRGATTAEALVPPPRGQPPEATPFDQGPDSGSRFRPRSASVGRETVIGRAGVQVVALRRIGDEISWCRSKARLRRPSMASPVSPDGQSFRSAIFLTSSARR